MNALTARYGNSANLTMSSREIAELTGKRHDHVLRDTRAMLVGLYGAEEVKSGLPDKDMFEVFCDRMGWGIAPPKLGNQLIQGVTVSRDSRGFVAEIGLDYNHSMTLISGYEVKLRKAIIDHWQSLEQKVGAGSAVLNPANFTRLQLIELAMQAEQERLLLEHKVEELEPKAKALDRMTLADGEVCLQTAGKLLQQRPNKFIAWLRSLGTWIFKRPGSARNSAYSDKINDGYLNVRTVTTLMPDGSERVNEQVVVTPKGLVKLAQMLGVSVGDGPMGGAA